MITKRERGRDTYTNGYIYVFIYIERERAKKRL